MFQVCSRLRLIVSPPYLRPGWTIFDKLYIFQGIVYVVSDSPSSVPDIRFLYSKALNIEEGKEAEDSRLPDASDIQVISTKQAAKLFGTGAHVIDGVSVRLLCISYLLCPYAFYTRQLLVNDPPQL